MPDARALLAGASAAPAVVPRKARLETVVVIGSVLSGNL
jgi:hypothetical protein